MKYRQDNSYPYFNYSQQLKDSVMVQDLKSSKINGGNLFFDNGHQSFNATISESKILDSTNQMSTQQFLKPQSSIKMSITQSFKNKTSKSDEMIYAIYLFQFVVKDVQDEQDTKDLEQNQQLLTSQQQDKQIQKFDNKSYWKKQTNTDLNKLKNQKFSKSMGYIQQMQKQKLKVLQKCKFDQQVSSAYLYSMYLFSELLKQQNLVQIEINMPNRIVDIYDQIDRIITFKQQTKDMFNQVNEMQIQEISDNKTSASISKNPPRKSLSDFIVFNTISNKQNYKNYKQIFSFAFREISKDYFLVVTTFIAIIFLLCEYYLKVNCQFSYPQLHQYCQTQQEIVYFFLREFVWFDVGLLIFMINAFYLNYKQETWTKSYIIIKIITYFTLKLLKWPFQDIYNILWTLIIVFHMILCRLGIKIFNLFEISGYSLMYGINLNLFSIVILRDFFNLPLNLQTIFGNIYLGLQRIVIQKYLLFKIKTGIKSLDDVRIKLILLFMQDFGLQINIIMTNPLDQLLFEGFFINLVVMNIYMYTQFHLWYYILEITIKAIWQKLLKDKFQYLRDKIIIWLSCIILFDVDEIFKQMKIKYYDQPDKITQYENLNHQDILRIFASYYIIAQIWSFLFITLTMITRMHVPYMHIQNLQKYYKINPQFNQQNLIQDSVYNIDVPKYLIFCFVQIISIVGVECYSYYYDQNYFTLKKLCFTSIYSRLFTFTYIVGSISSIIYR